MTYSERARTTTRRIPRILVAGLLVVIAAIAAVLGYQFACVLVLDDHITHRCPSQ